MRNVLGTKPKPEAISQTMSIALGKANDPWGVKIERVEVKDVSFPVNLQRAMETEGKAARYPSHTTNTTPLQVPLRGLQAT